MIKLRNLKVTKLQENETETEDATSIKYIYTLQDDDKDNVITLKCCNEKDILLGQELDITINSDQTNLEVHVQTEEEADEMIEDMKEAEAEEEICDECGEEHSEDNEAMSPKEEPEEELDLDKKKDAIKAGQKAQKVIKEEDLTLETKECPECQVNYEDPKDVKSINKTGKCTGCQPKKDKMGIDAAIKKEKKAKKPKPVKECKYYYRGGLCANSQMEAPFCGGIDDCEYMNETKAAEPEPTEKTKKPKKEKGSPSTPSKKKEETPAEQPKDTQKFEGMAYEYPTTYKGEKVTREIGVKDFSGEFVVMWVNEKTGGTHKVKSPALKFHDTAEAAQKELQAWAEKKKLKAIGPIEEAKKETAEKKEWKEDDAIVCSKDFPEDVLGGLEKDIVIQKHATAGILYAHAISVEMPGDDEGKIARFEDELHNLTGMDWAHVMDKTFNANKKQINGEE